MATIFCLPQLEQRRRRWVGEWARAASRTDCNDADLAPHTLVESPRRDGHYAQDPSRFLSGDAGGDGNDGLLSHHGCRQLGGPCPDLSAVAIDDGKHPRVPRRVGGLGQRRCRCCHLGAGDGRIDSRSRRFGELTTAFLEGFNQESKFGLGFYAGAVASYCIASLRGRSRPRSCTRCSRSGPGRSPS